MFAAQGLAGAAVRTVAIVQARLGSTRLLRKVLELIAGRPMIEHVIERARAIEGVDQVVLNVPEADVELTRLPYAVGVKDQEHDVLASYLYLAEGLLADTIIRITGDCVLLAPEICSDVLDLYECLDDAWAYCANDTLRSGWPDGTDCEVFSIDALRKAAACAGTAFEREHVTIWMRTNLANFGVLAPYAWEPDMMGVKLSVDTPEDLDRARGIYQHLEPGQFSMADTVTAWRASRGTV